jgi:hypothetical protein
LTVEDANKFAKRYYFPKNNRKFAVMAKGKVNLYTTVPKHINPGRIFCIKNEAALRKGFAIRYNNKFYQILNIPRIDGAQVEKYLNGKVQLCRKGKELKHEMIDRGLISQNRS